MCALSEMKTSSVFRGAALEPRRHTESAMLNIFALHFAAHLLEASTFAYQDADPKQRRAKLVT